MTHPALTDRSHVLIAGITGSGDGLGGKTVTANWWLSSLVDGGHADLGIFWNSKSDGFVRGAECSSLLDVAESYRDGHRLINYIPRYGNEIDEHDALGRFVRELPGSAAVVHDEAVDLLAGDSLGWFLRRAGNEASCKSLLLVQDPTQLPTSVRKNCASTVWVGPVTPSYLGWFRSLNLEAAYDEIRDSHDPYCWSIIDGDGSVETFSPVPVEFARSV